jgi:cell division septation protein DedD
MASATHDDGFHEIQLNGKQLVFLFMAVTVVSVVIFLCGVLVGRGVRIDRPLISVEAGAQPEAAPVTETAGTASGPVPVDGVDYDDRLSGATPPPEKIDLSAPPPTAKAEPVADPGVIAADAKPAPPPVPEAPAPKAAEPAALAEPPGPGVAVQVAAFRVRSEADALANRLIGKQYSAYVVPPATGAPAIFRVRVGKFKEQREADRVVARLKKEEKFEPWIVR